MSARIGARRAGAGLIVLSVLAGAVLLAGAYIEGAYRHVVVEIFNVDDFARVSVNCRIAEQMDADSGESRVDLGYLRPNDRVALSASNELGGAAWGFRVFINGSQVFEPTKGTAEVAGPAGEEFQLTMAQWMTAAGNRLGPIGCESPLFATEELEKERYRRSPDAHEVKKKNGVPVSWSAPLFPFAAIEFAADWTLLFLAIVGFVAAVAAAIASSDVRRLIRDNWKWGVLLSGANLVINLVRSSGLEGFAWFLIATGILLLFLTAATLLWPRAFERFHAAP